MALEKEQEALCRMFIKKLLFHAHPYEIGYQSRVVFTFTRDEKEEMERIVNSEDN